MRKLVIAALFLAPIAMPAAAPAQDRVLTIFGDDKCPENTICVRAPETERFRIPKVLRDSPNIAPGRQSWASRASSIIDAGSSPGAASCTAQGPVGWNGCWAQQMRAAKAARRDQATADTPVLDK